MTYEQAVAYCEALHGSGIRLGLDRLRHALAVAGDPQRRLRVVHVAGTNGKGSTARMIQSVLTCAGYRVGLYSSPAVTGVCDTITVDGVGMSPACFADWITRWVAVQESLVEAERLTEFELMTAMAFDYFAEERVDICVLECGMGGREDATNVCPPPLAAVFTTIARDHTAFLGDTVEEIAWQKSGIMKAPCAVISAPSQSEDALAVLFAQAAEKGLTVRMPCIGAAELLPSPAGQTRFRFDAVEYTVPLGGGFQVENALTALETLRALAPCGFTADEAACRAGLAAATLPCRQEVVCTSPLVMLDGAHNPHGIAAVAAVFSEWAASGAKPTVLFGMLRDKDTAACAAAIAPYAARVICCTPPSERALEAAQLATQFCAAGVSEVLAVPDVKEAWDTALSLAGDTPLFVGGSFYTAAAIRPFATAFVAERINKL